MIRRPLLLSAAVIVTSLALTGCGGGSSSPTPTPTPTSTTTATPTPTTSPTYSAFPLAALAEFYTISASTNYTGDLATGPVTLGAAGTEGRSDRVRLAVGNDTAANTFVIREALEESRFVTANLTTAPDASVTEFVYRINDASTPPVAGKYAQGEYLNNIIPSKVTSDTALALTRTSYAGWLRADGTTGQTRLTYTVFGYPTAIGDVPTTGTNNYTARIAGRVVQVAGGGTGTQLKLGGTVTISTNFATGLVTVTANVTTINGAVETPYGTFSGTGAIAPGATQFNGSFGGASPIPGTFAGGFFGSQGEQIGITFALLGNIGGVETRAVGSVVGKKS
ncbi:hypothetical protein ACFQ1E_08390 [Sphingomonas canadensis]|uniref:Transferrin-binding protein B C-lobe/N-lobe beta barrel domain-containing protein n=1 Tax=Sphingomonas canadensis TaxID=1219257 RepID=A0ABW3H6B0_9SPHN|nr:hypothetical protein [Sphingomonas canadensis]MCW3836056.1 hypothetical protein [Sphingomonas canadensis]